MKSNEEIKMMTPITIVLIVLMLAGLVVGIYRLANGLGASTNLNDDFPWGLWIGFDILGGAALAAGGFIIAGAVYLFNMKKYRPIVRSAILTGFIGYLLESVSVFFDLGHPLRIWYPGIMWNVSSVLWIIAILVIVFTLTLAVQFSPVLWEKLKAEAALKFVNKIMVGVVLFGVMISVLHQSSLGAIYLIVSTKLSPIWYNSMLPYFFLVSAVMIGLSMVSLETIVAAKAFNHEVREEIVFGLAKGSIITLIVYLIMEVIFLARGPGIGAVFSGTTEGNMYLLEVGVGVVIPLILLSMKNIRQNTNNILWVNILVIFGVLTNRMNVAIFGVYGFNSASGASYFPSAPEFILTLGIVALGIFGYKLTAKYLPLFQEP